jgi:hypothetical protein
MTAYMHAYSTVSTLSQMGAMLTSPCLRCPATVTPDVSSSPCSSGPNGLTGPATSGTNVHVALIQVTPV